MAESLAMLCDVLEQGQSLQDAVHDILQKHSRIIYNGDCYDPNYIQEMEKRGVPHLRKAPDAFVAFKQEKNVKLFTSQKVLSASGVVARAEVMLMDYINTVCTEAQTLVNMLRNAILPAVIQDLKLSHEAKDIQVEEYFSKKIKLADSLFVEATKLEKVMDNAPSLEQSSSSSLEPEATYCMNNILPQMSAVRKVLDQMERLVARDIWPFPTYDALLFSHHFDTA